jgi:outer membrane protein assembly factor BamB
VAWRVELPAKGPSSPVVVGDRVFVTCSGGDQQDELYVVCYATSDGRELWRRRFWATGRSHCHPLSANAAPTPTSDGRHVFAFFSSNDLFCLDLEGRLCWARGLAVDHPRAGNDAGMSSSPVVVEDLVVCQVENQGDSFAIALDRRTGETRWEVPREKKASWASPLVFQPWPDAAPMVLLQSNNHVSLLNARTGQAVWDREIKCNAIPSAALQGNRLYVPANGTTVFEFLGPDSVSEVWNSSRIAPSTASTVVAGDNLYCVARGGVLNCADASTGERVWQMRIGGQHWCTPLVAGRYAYLFSQDGEATVVDLSNVDPDDAESSIVHRHKFADEVFLASPAVAGNAMYIRSDRHLWKIAEVR